MSQLVNATVAVNLTVNDVVTDHTVAASGDVIGIQESYLNQFNQTGGTAPTIGLSWSAALTFVASTPQTIDLRSLTGPRGSTVTFASVACLYIYNLATTTAFGLKFGNPGAGGWFAPFDALTDTYTVPMNSRWLLENADVSAPWVVDSSHHLIK